MVEIPSHGLFENLSGQKFGRLNVVQYLGRIGRNNQWECLCECGNVCRVAGMNLKSGHTRSCSCLHKEMSSAASKTHGESKSDEYSIWHSMKRRCYDPKNNKFYRYGARGIIVCERWLNSFDNFLFDIGKRPSMLHSIDRKDNNGNYDPGNCRWATKKEQANNTSKNVHLTINGVTKPLSIWAHEHGLDRSVVYERFDSGVIGEKLLIAVGLRTKKITFNGITDTYSGWSERKGIKSETISQRIRRDRLTAAEALTRKVRSCA
jgi:hypothetical protein